MRIIKELMNRQKKKNIFFSEHENFLAPYTAKSTNNYWTKKTET